MTSARVPRPSVVSSAFSRCRSYNRSGLPALNSRKIPTSEQRGAFLRSVVFLDFFSSVLRTYKTVFCGIQPPRVVRAVVLQEPFLKVSSDDPLRFSIFFFDSFPYTLFSVTPRLSHLEYRAVPGVLRHALHVHLSTNPAPHLRLENTSLGCRFRDGIRAGNVRLTCHTPIDRMSGRLIRLMA